MQCVLAKNVLPLLKQDLNFIMPWQNRVSDSPTPALVWAVSPVFRIGWYPGDHCHISGTRSVNASWGQAWPSEEVTTQQRIVLYVNSFRVSCCATTKKPGNQLESNRITVHLRHRKIHQMYSIFEKENINIMVFPPNSSGCWILLYSFLEKNHSLCHPEEHWKP